MAQNFYGEVVNGKHADAVLREYFPDYDYKGVIIEVGAYDPKQLSNSYHFEQNGWKAFCVEPNPYCIERFMKANRSVIPYAVSDKNQDNVDFTVVTGFIEPGWMAGFSALTLDPELMVRFPGGVKATEVVKVSTRTLDSLIEQYNIGDSIDILSLDIEGGEWNALQGFNLSKYKPKLILLENHFNTNGISEYIQSFGYKLDSKYSYNEYYLLTAQSQ